MRRAIKPFPPYGKIGRSFFCLLRGSPVFKLRSLSSLSSLPSLPLAKRLQVVGWFTLVNCLLAIMLGLRYLTYLPPLEDGLSRAYLVLALFGQMSLLGALAALPTVLLIWLRPFWLQSLLLALCATLGLSVLLIDTLVFDQYRFHMNAVVLGLVFSGQVVEFPWQTWLTVATGVGSLWFAELCLHRWLWRRALLLEQDRTPQTLLGSGWGRRFAALVLLSVLSTHVLHAWAVANGVASITRVTQFLPAFYPAVANDTLRAIGLADEQALAKREALQSSHTSSLNYPQRTLQVESVVEPVDIVFIVLECWRADSFNERVTPNLWAFAQQGRIFEHHLSTGNATRTGIFGLFYGLPGTYWHAFLGNRHSPLLMDRLQALDYQLGIFASAHLENPEFNDTVFSKVPKLRLRSRAQGAPDRDIEITEEWLAWQRTRDTSQPAFSFLFYDSPHAYTFSEGYAHRFEPMVEHIDYLALNNDYDVEPLHNLYRTSVHFTDSQVGRVLDALRQSPRGDRTLVVIAGDHGQELNDNGLNYWGHNSNYTDAQIRVPFALVGPGISPDNPWQQARYMTSHEDLAPTIMRNFLGVTNPLPDYSTGADLLAPPVQREWLISSNYSSYAIIDQESITHVTGAGNYHYLDRRNWPRSGALNYRYIEQALHDMSRFYR